jgi:hypothetical protein
MSIKVWVVSSSSGEVVDGAIYDATSPVEAIFWADEYQKHFGSDGTLRISAGTGLSDEDRASLHEKASARGITLVPTFP